MPSTRMNKLTPIEIRELFFPSKGTAARRRLRRNKRKMRKIAKAFGKWWDIFCQKSRYEFNVRSECSSFYSFIQRQNESQKLSGQYFIRRRLFHDSAGCG